MGRFVAQRTNYDLILFRVYIVKDAILTYTQFPHRSLVLPGWIQTLENFPIPCLSAGLVDQLLTYFIENHTAFESGEFPKVCYGFFTENNLIHENSQAAINFCPVNRS